MFSDFDHITLGGREFHPLQLGGTPYASECQHQKRAYGACALSWQFTFTMMPFQQ